MANLQAKIDKNTEEVLNAEKEYKSAKKSKSAEEEKKRNTLKRLTVRFDSHHYWIILIFASFTTFYQSL